VALDFQFDPTADGGVSIKELARRTGLSRNTIRAALRASEPPTYRRAPGGSKLDPFKDEIHRLLRDEPDMPGQRVRELIAQLGFDGGKTIVDDYLREVRPVFQTPRTYQRTIYRPGEICQFDLCAASAAPARPTGSPPHRPPRPAPHGGQLSTGATGSDFDRP
jgi:Winged helix-turn-helix DNA-binding